MWTGSLTVRRFLQRLRGIQPPEPCHDDDQSLLPVVEVEGESRVSSSSGFGQSSIATVSLGQTNIQHQDSGGDSSTEALSTILLLIESGQWEEVSSRLESEREHVSTARLDQSTGNTILHVAITSKAPLSIVQQLLTICPEFSRCWNYSGALPLHLACCCRAPADIIGVVLKAYPEAACLTNHYRHHQFEAFVRSHYPLQLLCDHGHLDVGAYREILSTTQGMATVHSLDPFLSRTPLSAWNASQSMALRQERLDRMRRMVPILQHLRRQQEQQRQQTRRTAEYSHEVESPSSQSDFEREMELLREDSYWRVAELLIVADHERLPFVGPCKVLTASRVLHGALSNPQCPPSLQEYAIWVYHEHLTESCTDDGDVPLHISAVQTNRNALLVVDLMLACPQACRIRNAKGNLPLALAVRNRNLSWSHGLSNMVKHYPPALLELPGFDSTVLWPQVLSRVSDDKQELYSLMKACPTPFSRRR